MSLTPQQHAAIDLMLQGKDNVQVAEELGVHRSTLYRWTTDPEFSRLLSALFIQGHEHTLRVTASEYTRSVQTLADIRDGHVVYVTKDKETIEVMPGVSDRRMASRDLANLHLKQMALRLRLTKAEPTDDDLPLDDDAGGGSDYDALLRESSEALADSAETLAAFLDDYELETSDADWVTNTRQPRETET